MRTDDFVYYAHSLRDKPCTEWQKLEEHLKNVAERARQFAASFGAGDWAYAAGLLHDMGKYSIAFQERIRGKSMRVDHSTAGACDAITRYGAQIGKILAYVIAGHHAGLADGRAKHADDRDSLEWRLNKAQVPGPLHCESPVAYLPALSFDQLAMIFKDRKNNEDASFRFAFFVRMLFSCIVDADRLDAEEFGSPLKSEKREQYPSLPELKQKCDAYIQSLIDNATPTDVNKQRRQVLTRCRNAAERPMGLFQLTVPTGGGKTISSMAFALDHAIKHDLQRVIYVIPYTSIIEQNAEVFRNAFGHLGHAVVEHHSNFDETSILQYGDDMEQWELAIDNWDAPIIVTTNVQFFESLFSHHAGRCRKLHNIMNSVVIFDEAQMLPTNMLYPCMRVIEELVNHCNSTVVLCTATQPALEKREDRPNFKGLDIKTENEISGSKPQIEELYSSLRRVNVAHLGRISDSALVQSLKDHDEVLCIVNTRGRARRIYDLLKGQTLERDYIFHLSANMCPEHRAETLKCIKTALDAKQPCRVISTQVIEAGVDIDFPVVYREIAGIDSIAQAAGRCNREGRLTDSDGRNIDGRVYVFEPEEGIVQIFRRQVDSTREVLRHYPDRILSLDAIREFFELYFWKRSNELDEKNITAKLAEDSRRLNFPFRKISSEFRVIDDYSIPVIVKWRNGEMFVQELQEQIAKGYQPGKNLLRKLQRFTVNIYPQAFAKHKGLSIIYLIPEHERFAVLTNMDIYSEECGIALEDPYFRYPESNIC